MSKVKITRFLEGIEQKATHNYEKDFKMDVDYTSLLHGNVDDYERSYVHYYAHSHYYFGLKDRIVLNILAGIILIPAWIYCMLKSRRLGEIDNLNEGLAVVNLSNISTKDIFPDELNNEFSDVKVIRFPNRRQIDRKARAIVRKSWANHPFQPYYIYCMLRRFCETCSLIYEYKPEGIIVYGRERDFIVPLTTLYCESLNIKHIGFMHGDDYYSPAYPLMRFTKYYVWDKHYADMYMELLWPSDQFIVYTPGKLKKHFAKKDNYDYFITYYFSGENKEIVSGVKNAFDILTKKKHKCKVRPHPRFSDINMLSEVFKDYEIEDPAKININDSIDSSRYICALNTTVLLEGFFGGKDIVIDDYSSKKRYESLTLKKYILLSKNHLLLSNLIRGND